MWIENLWHAVQGGQPIFTREVRPARTIPLPVKEVTYHRLEILLLKYFREYTGVTKIKLLKNLIRICATLQNRRATKYF